MCGGTTALPPLHVLTWKTLVLTLLSPLVTCLYVGVPYPPLVFVLSRFRNGPFWVLMSKETPTVPCELRNLKSTNAIGCSTINCYVAFWFPVSALAVIEGRKSVIVEVLIVLKGAEIIGGLL